MRTLLSSLSYSRIQFPDAAVLATIFDACIVCAIIILLVPVPRTRAVLRNGQCQAASEAILIKDH
jgi:hypothetical protein